MVEDGRVDGIIAISRAIGDWEYKSTNLEAHKMAVSSYPEVKTYEINKLATESYHVEKESEVQTQNWF